MQLRNLLPVLLLALPIAASPVADPPVPKESNEPTMGGGGTVNPVEAGDGSSGTGSQAGSGSGGSGTASTNIISEPCSDGTPRNKDGKCPSDYASARPQCNSGTQWDDATASCIPSTHDCPYGTWWNDVPQTCIPHIMTCPEGMRPNADITACVPN